MKALLTAMLILPAILNGTDIEEGESIPKEIVETSDELPADRIFFPLPFHRAEAVRIFEKGKTAGNVSIITDEVAQMLVGAVYSNPDRKITVLVPWFYIEENEISVENFNMISTQPPVVRVQESSVFVQAGHIDISAKANRVKCPIVILVDKAPEEARLFSKTIGW